ncbi:family 20 glycosylhydrolase [Clostridium sp. 'deep sea']|uniref:beta-N-acetylhexosaminidase n=1 Tax=Clostridium sp. 'deep sea' TaxID=2779445 RepID=UPI0018965608|nr:family 20 glycosylhydrolase [Clostridium sp. 'deep sea']QOR35259.1 family 20 glycosylhydrolase [Clostridium sp. 'deep sea']
MYLLPVPLNIETREGCFTLTNTTSINIPLTNYGMFLGNQIAENVKKYAAVDISINSHNTDNQVKLCLSKELTGEEYELRVTENYILFLAGTNKGLFYALQTFIQLLKQHKRQIPCLYIKDKPAFNNRGFYHDVTRGKVPSLNSLKELADLCAFYKLNQLQLYIEHTFLFKGHSEIWNITEPLTANEIIELDNYCAQRQIELVPSLATFGHLYEALRSESFKELNELENVSDKPYSWVDRMNHYTLDVSNAKSIKFVEDMIDQFVPLFRSNHFNICADETFDLGQGKTKELAEELGQSKLYVDFLNKVVNCVKKHNLKVMFWGDIIIKHPEYIEQLPKDIICLNWWYWLNYEEEKVKMIKDRNFKQYVCPGVHGWNKLMNDFNLAYDNIKMMSDYGKKYNAIGLLNTDWGDYGHWNFFASSIPGLIYGAQFSWSQKELSYQGMNNYIDKIQFGLNDISLMNLLDKVANKHHLTLLALVQWQEKNEVKYLKKVTNDTEKIVLDNILLNTISSRLLDLQTSVSVEQREYLQAYYVATQGIIIFNNLIPHIKNKALKENLSTVGFKTPTQCALALEDWLYQFKQVWLKRNKPSELYRIVEFTKNLCKTLRCY